MRKSVVIILAVLAVLVTNAAQFVIQFNMRLSDRQLMAQETAYYKAYKDKLGDMVSVYTVTGITKSGQEITADCIQPMDLPEACITAAHVQDASEILGKYFKISLSPGTPITTDTYMSSPMPDTLREVDMVVCRWPVGLSVGDYVDLRITYPMGQDFIVLSHMRVQQINGQTFKVFLDEAQQHKYQAALVDYYLSSSSGSDLYVSKYVEPGIQEAAKPYYAVPEGIAAIMAMDPNITNKAEAQVNAQIRNEIQNAIDSVPESATSALQSGRGQNNSKINGDQNKYANEHDQQVADGGGYYEEDWSSPVTDVETTPPSEGTETPDYGDEGVIE